MASIFAVHRSSMDSDSDSDGSYISATPPRDPQPPPPAPPPPPAEAPPRPALLFSRKSTTRVKASAYSRVILKPQKASSRRAKLPPRPVPEPSQPEPPAPPPDPLPAPSFPFQIRRPSDQNRPVSDVDSIGTLPAGYFGKFASFSKIRRTSLNLESTEEELPRSTGSASEIAAEFDGIGCPEGERVQAEAKCEAVISENCEAVSSSIPLPRAVKRYSNLIGRTIPMQPPKLRKSDGEGNFVRLNINGYKRRFANKGKSRNSYGSSSRKSYRKSRKKFKPAGDGESENVYAEDGLVTETIIRNQEETEGAKFDSELIEGAVLAARNETSDENLVNLLKLVFGYDTFRDGQLEAIKMVLSGKSTMLVLPTGAGKSLCYQLPAMVLSGITLVVSPLVALMIDQLKHLPPMIRGGLLCSSQAPEEVSETLRMIQEGTIKVLFVSPERFLNAEFLSIFSHTSVISLLVVDEAHCVSEWSHNFRPSYMRLRASLLRVKMNVDCILAMTATASTTTLLAVMSALEIPPTNLIQKALVRDNLKLSVSASGNRMKDLLMLIKSSPYSEVKSIIIYCKFQYETDQISKHLCDYNISAKSYHSGIPAKDRSRTQEMFCSNKIRVVVATVAFGMGLDKRNVGAVIHYSLPESLEEYVQEIGRAGRDGKLSYCHLFFDDITYFKLRSLMHSDGVDEYGLNKFLSQIFATNGINSRGKICSLVKESASRKFDLKEEVMLTILTQLELGEVQYLRLLPQLNVTCTVNFHKTSPVLLADKDFVVAAILKKSDNKQGQYVFDIPTVANGIGITAIDLSNRLHNLKFKGEITYELKDPAYCYTVIKVPENLCFLAANLTKWLSEVESCKVRKFDTIYNAAVFAVNECEKKNGCVDMHHTPCLQRKILDYFSGDDNGDVPNKMIQSSPFLRADIKVFLLNNAQAKFTPRAVARIMHGIASPAYPSTTWSKTHFWGRYVQVDFKVLMEAAQAELMKIAGKDIL